MSGSGLWFSRFAQAGEGWLPLVAFGSAAWLLASAASGPEFLDDAPAPTRTAAPTAQREGVPQVANAERSGAAAAAAGTVVTAAR